MALLTNISEYQAVLPIPKNASGDRLPDSDAAEYEYLVNILGTDLYDQLVTAYKDEALSADQTELLALCQKVVAPFAWLNAIPLSQINLDMNGVHVIESETVRTAYKWEYNNAVGELTRRGYAAQEQLITYLIKNSDTFPLWAESSYNDAQGFMIIRSGYDMGSVHTLIQPHRCYALLRGVLLTDVADYIINHLGEAYYEDLNGRILSDTLTEDEKKVIGKLRAAATTRAMYHAAQTLSIRFAFGSGFTIAKETMDTSHEREMAAYDKQVQAFMAQMEGYAASHMSKAMKYIMTNASATKFPVFYASDKYTDPTEVGKPLDNTGHSFLRF